MKARAVLAGILLCVAGASLIWRRSTALGNGPATVQEENPADSVKQDPVYQATRAFPEGGVRLSRALLERESQRFRRDLWKIPLAARARDPHYERLLDDGPRDLERQAQVLSTLREFLADKPNAAAGEVACNADFCRAELLATGEVDLLASYGDAFVSALATKGSALVLTDHSGRDNPKLTCYFGRDASWRSPGSNAEVSTR